MEEKIKVHDVLTCGLNESISQISKKLKEKNVRRIFVIDGAGKLKGIITTTDLVYKCLADNCKDLTAKDVMTSDVKSVDKSDSLDTAVKIMNEIKSFNCPLTDGGKIVGLLSYHDILAHAYSKLREN